MVDRTGKPVEVRSNNDQFSCDIRNLKSAQSQFPLVTQPKRMISQTVGGLFKKGSLRSVKAPTHRLGQCWMNSEARLSLNAVKKFFITNSSQLKPNKIAKFYKKNHCDNNRIFVKFINKILFLPSMSSPRIEDQKIIMELSGRLQELQNEVNCMNDSRDFRDAESICSGNSHVTSPPGFSLDILHLKDY